MIAHTIASVNTKRTIDLSKFLIYELLEKKQPQTTAQMQSVLKAFVKEHNANNRAKRGQSSPPPSENSASSSA